MSLQIKNLEEVLLPKYLGNDNEIIECDVKRLTAAGENYGSLMLALGIKLKDKDGKENILNVVAKAVPRNEFIQKIFKSPLTFKKELEFYRTVVPTLREFLTENGIGNILDFFPEFYGGRLGLEDNVFDNDAVILLENLKFRGYYCADRTKGFDLEPAKFMLKNLAALHAVSIALKLKKPKEFNEKVLPCLQTAKPFDGLQEESVKAVIGEMVKLAEEIETDESVLDGFRAALESAVHNSAKNPSPPREPFATFVHNDFWVNNSMLKTEENKIVGNKIVDFQLTEYSSPARDVIFFIFNSLQNDIVLNYYDDLIQFYHQQFTLVLDKLNVDLEPFSFEAFKKEMDLAAKEIFFQCFIMLSPIFATEDSVIEIENMQESDFMEKKEIPQTHKDKFRLLLKEFRKRHWF